MSDNNRTDHRSCNSSLVTVGVSRRRLLSAATFPMMVPLLDWLSKDAIGAESVPPLNRFPRMVHEFFVEQVRQAERRNLRVWEQVNTEDAAQKHVETLRAKIRECFGPEPERTPLNPRITGVVERDAYKIEKLIFESRPDFPVTANVYVPKGRELPMPGVIGTCGHSSNGKAAEPYQSFAQGLAKLGYVCLIYDPIGQGERSQYVDDDLTPRRKGTVHEHLYCGNQQFLVGEFLGAWRAWDGIRALDYLLTRKEVDPEQIGVTGNSGGGTMTTWLAGVESRWTMAAPSCFVTTFRRNMENELPADTEQCPPRALALGLDHADFLAAMAPKPVLILSKERDFFDARGAEEAYNRLKGLYSLLGKQKRVSMFTGPSTHGYSQENREAMYGWFNGVTRVSAAKTEPDITIETDETLWCTPKGQIAGLDAKTVFQFTADQSRALGKNRGAVEGEQLTHRIRQILKLRTPKTDTPDYRILRDWRSREYPTKFGISYAVETEQDIFALVYMLTNEPWYSRPPREGNRAILYVSHRSSDAELRDEPLIRDVIKTEPETRLFTCDVRGIGESQPDTCGNQSFDDPYGCDYFYAIHSLMLDRPYVGQKTMDVLRVLDWLASYGYTDIHIVAKGWGALPATFAALLNDRISQVTLKNALTSYADIAEHEDYDWPLAALLPNVLAHFDMPDCYRALAAKKIQQIEPWDAVYSSPTAIR
ncbi:alpha/beta hydrolase family protein [Novipirellula artificiosorum]|uniref:Alpha/beta hydrolase family protein n=1 Tax=Novipirellula artificiosorum TaxID=2528016 RepID=A0A5C6D3M5_9BACT|nr:prolyl oligopeptidase family serine peptidase [Novipirellula artificiosorum]TWU31823.1 Alpha/beta hydrolase family protein [Novipirellula artificiosorum]